MIENFRMAIEAIMSGKMRAFLTMLGIIIGIGSVIALISLGRGVENYIFSEFDALGANRLTLSSSSPEADTRDRIEPLTMADIKNFKSQRFATFVNDVAADFNTPVQLTYQGETMFTTARGYTANMDVIQSWGAESGSFITEQHIADKQRVAVVGLDVVEELFGSETVDPIGAQLQVNDQVFEIIGVMEEQASAFGNSNTAIVVPISVAQTRLASARYGNDLTVNTIYVDIASRDTIAEAEALIDRYLYEKHGMRNVDEKDYSIGNPSAIQDAVRGITGILTAFLGMIASISLIVGGIGIMNIMLVTVTERTREIGLRKAVGATPDRILLQFLIESIVLSLVGGIVGIILGWLIAFIGTTLVDGLVLSVEPDAVFIATFVSIAVGVIFGILPARQAANMNPIDALRYE